MALPQANLCCNLHGTGGWLLLAALRPRNCTELPVPLRREKDEVIKSLRSRLSIAQQQAQQQVAIIVEPPAPAVRRASGDAAVGTLEAQNAQLEVSHIRSALALCVAVNGSARVAWHGAAQAGAPMNTWPAACPAHLVQGANMQLRQRLQETLLELQTAHDQLHILQQLQQQLEEDVPGAPALVDAALAQERALQNARNERVLQLLKSKVGDGWRAGREGVGMGPAADSGRAHPLLRNRRRRWHEAAWMQGSRHTLPAG